VTLEIRASADVPWDDVRVVFGTRGDPSTCWCQWFKQSSAEWRATSTAVRRDALCEQAPHSPGLVAYLEGEPVGWVAVEPRTAYKRLATTRVAVAGTTEPWDDDSVWAVTCFVVRTGFRRQGLSSELLAAAVEHARAGGARLIEAYPVDVAAKATSSSELYHGPLSTFLAEGFTIVSRPTPARPVVQLEL
jgi:GNAT superfamily N-acetyltransferase